VVIDPSLFDAMEYRMVGPFRGGRVTAVAGVVDEPFTFYMGATGGGVWKTTDAGESWSNVSDGYIGVGSIGAIAVAQSDANVVYVGTGSACPRGNVSVGDGIYRSTDAGRTFTHIGLPEAGQIGAVVVHPDNPDLVYVAALGHIFGPNDERGVYRSRDGGATWEQVLFVSRSAGAVDLSMNPRNPRELYAAIWRAERKPWTMIDGGEDSGLYHSTDGGDTWKLLTDEEEDNGLPSGLLGRIGVAISPANPRRAWALITDDGDEGGLYRTDDAGESWSRVSADHDLTARGWYYTHVHADPQDDNTVYVNNGPFLRSIDGGRTFQRRPTPHGDNHDLWINPNDPRFMIQSNDGGANVTLDGGESWSTQHNQPTAEFYRVTVDNQYPYRLYGAQQDNSTISIPSFSPADVSPEQYWYSVGGSESGHIAVHPDNPDLIYAGNYIGQIDRLDRKTGFARDVIIYPQMQDGTAPRDLKYRFQWNAPIRFSPNDPDVIYHTSNYVHRSRDGGMSWQTISPELTRNEPEKEDLPGGPVQHDHTGVEVYNTVFAFEEAPGEPGVLWAGADDGLIHVSRDDGRTWTDVTPPAMEIDSTVNEIHVSPHARGRVFVAVQRYRMDDMRPYLWRTNDYGATWELLTDGTNGIPDDHPVRTVEEDPDREGLIYVGTELGMFVSFDDGAHWQSLQLNLPVVPITDITVHDQDLVVATQGRSFWILDDLTPLHQVSESVAAEDAWLYTPRDTVRAHQTRGFSGERAPESPAAGALIYYWLAEEPDERIELEILDAGGEVLRTFRSAETEDAADSGAAADDDEEDDDDEPDLPAEQGMNRFVWDLKREGPDLIDGALFSLAYTGGYFVLPGTYTARLTVGGEASSGSFRVVKDPRLQEVTQADLEAQNALLVQIVDELDSVHDAIRELRSVREQAREVARRAGEAGYEGDWSEQAEAIADKLTAVEDELIQHRAETGQDLLNYPPRLDDQFAYLYSHVYPAYGRPTQGDYQRLDDLRVELAPHLEAVRAVIDTDVAAFNEALRAAGVPAVIWRR
jgi:photosystem II stability/assembly factor-like uncharacterized protein